MCAGPIVPHHCKTSHHSFYIQPWFFRRIIDRISDYYLKFFLIPPHLNHLATWTLDSDIDTSPVQRLQDSMGEEGAWFIKHLFLATFQTSLRALDNKRQVWTGRSMSWSKVKKKNGLWLSEGLDQRLMILLANNCAVHGCKVKQKPRMRLNLK